MAAAIKLAPIGIDRDLRAVLEEIASPAARSRFIAEVAREEIGKARIINRSVLGREAPYETFVDGRRSDRLEDVRPDGVVVAEFDVRAEGFKWIEELLVLASPVGLASDKRPGHPGLYQRSHVLIVDGDAYDPGEPLPATFDEAFFVNTQPYARKIERGLSNQAPDGVYETVAVLAQRRLGNIMRVAFGYRTPNFGAIAGWAATTKMATPMGRGRNRMGPSRSEWLQRQPAIIITIRAR